jgi:hypothetical protein
MTIEPIFRRYGIDADVQSMRHDIGELITPHLGQIYIWGAAFDHRQTQHTQDSRLVRLTFQE